MIKGIRTRRVILAELASAAALSMNSVATGSAEQSISVDALTPNSSGLIAMGRRFEALAKKIDDEIEGRLDIEMSMLDEFGRVEAEIVSTSASTLEELCVKARAACWALLGDVEPGNYSTMDKRMAFSIVRDLVRLTDPSLLQPGALQRLVDEIENNADLAPSTRLRLATHSKA